jgi:hypothetical protein
MLHFISAVCGSLVCSISILFGKLEKGLLGLWTTNLKEKEKNDNPIEGNNHSLPLRALSAAFLSSQ